MGVFCYHIPTMWQGFLLSKLMPFKPQYHIYYVCLLDTLTILFATVLFLHGCTINKDPLRRTALLLQRGKIKEDTSYLYSLPYTKGTSHLLIQGYLSSYSHKNRAALDFKMKQGTPVHAARGGVV